MAVDSAAEPLPDVSSAEKMASDQAAKKTKYRKVVNFLSDGLMAQRFQP